VRCDIKTGCFAGSRTRYSDLIVVWCALSIVGDGIFLQARMGSAPFPLLCHLLGILREKAADPGFL
jgi:hypothetical protein